MIGGKVFLFLFFLLLWFSPARAEENFASGIYLAYVETGDDEADRVSYNGLAGLAETLRARTTIRVRGVRGVNPESDRLYYFPFLYWPMTEGQRRLSPGALRNLQGYMAEGGMIFFDTRDAQFGDTAGETPGTRRLRELTQGLRIPELVVVSEGHILTKSFYLLNEFPGRFAGGKLWAEKEPNQSFDAVTSVIIGSGDYAAAWTRDPGDQSRLYVEPGGERQREMAWRVGVNVTMAALAGNYKADQVHVPYILKRMGR